MTQEEQAISERAVVFAKQNRTRIARDLACLETYSSDEYPVSVFMAGSPGAGKTEVSRAFIGMMQAGGSKALRIDPDDFRVYFPSEPWIWFTSNVNRSCWMGLLRILKWHAEISREPLIKRTGPPK